MGVIGCLALGSGGGCRPQLHGWVQVPAGECRLGKTGAEVVPVSAFRLSRTEVSVAHYVRFLNDEPAMAPPAHLQIRWVARRYLPAPGQARRPIAWVSHQDARAYCRWLARVSGLPTRLPSAAEWEYAARCGRDAVRYPWGWGDARARANVDGSGPAPVRSYPASPWGVSDMAGNLAEWCDSSGAETTVRGGSWADRTPEAWAVYASTSLPKTYRDGDVGFRVAVGAPTPAPGEAGHE